VTDLDGAILQRYEADSPRDNAELITDRLVDLIEQALAEVGRERVVGIGIAVPGVADTERGRMVVYVDLNLRDFPIGDRVQARTGFFPRIYNRSTCAAMGEKWQGDGRSTQSLFYVALDAGISGGLILRGQSYKGAGPAIAEIGHFTVAPDGPLCFCGNQGCLQMVASSSALANRARELIKLGHASTLSAQVEGHLELIEGSTVMESAGDNDELSLRVLAEAADYVGLAIGNIINLLSPEMVVLGGGLIWSYPTPWVEMIRASIQRRTLSVTLQGAQIVVSQLGKDNRCIGAAALAVRHWLISQSPPHFFDLAEVTRRQGLHRM
jgi:glucokinase